MRPRLTALVLFAVLMAACGKSSELQQTQANMAKQKSGTIDLRLAASAGSGDTATGPSGFRLAGPFSFEGKHDLAVFDLTYTQLLGANSKVTKVSSTGSAAFVDTGAKTYRVAQKDLGPLRLDDSPSGGFDDLGIAGWVENPKTTKGSSTDRITGEVDAPDLLSDLARVAGPLGGDSQLAALNGDSAKRLRKLVKASSIEVVTGAKDHQLQSLHAVIDFGTRAPNELRHTLGKYAQARIDVRLSMRKLTAPLRVAVPDRYVKL
ncbi:MAG: hypothetical protein QOK28_3233 [Actinomycetota bacterium]|jgi:hypothetical protein